jgi:hypothetical protein
MKVNLLVHGTSASTFRAYPECGDKFLRNVCLFKPDYAVSVLTSVTVLNLRYRFTVWVHPCSTGMTRAIPFRGRFTRMR